MSKFGASFNIVLSHKVKRKNMSSRSAGRTSQWCRGVALLVGISACANVLANSSSLGWLEWSWLEPGHIKIKTKLDTGAKTSSLHAEAIDQFERDGVPWVRFRVPLSQRLDDSDYGRDLVVEREIVRETRIKNHGPKSRARLVVEMRLCIGGRVLDTQVTLADRSQFNYPLLLGRSALAQLALVDSSRIFTASKSCPAPSKPKPDA